MSENVFANGREVSAKADGNKSIAAMPDICLSPPSPPAGPIPIPYPNFSDATKTSSGSKKVKIGNKEVGLKNKSVYKSSKGDEAATRNFGMGVVTHKISGGTQHAAWSFDVKIEGQNAIRFMDLTTHNHGSTPNNLALTIDAADMAPPGGGDPECEELQKKAVTAVEEDIEGGALPNNAALVTAKSSSAGSLKSMQPPDKIISGKEAGYCSSTKSPGDTLACGGDSQMKYADNSQCNCDHAESKVIEKMISNQAKGGSLTMRINWNNGGEMSPQPCGQCMGAICKTAAVCNIEIYLCVGKPMKKKKAPCKTTVHGANKAKKVGRLSTTNWETPPGFWS